MNDTEYVQDALRAWASTYPRRVTKYQRSATSAPEAVELLLEAEREPDNWPFISTYSFPNGHSSEGNIPRVDRLFIDMDVESDGEYRSGREREDAWIRDMSRLLVRVRKVARFLLESESPDSWQASLSGNKGVHLDLVFPPISTANRTYGQFDNGMDAYVMAIAEYLKDETNISDLDEYIDVSSADLSRMRRVPNTLHDGATAAFGEDRFCVPVTLRELASITPSDYIELTRARREVTDAMTATPSEQAAAVLTHHIQIAPESTRSSRSGSSSDVARLDAYVANQNDRIGVEDLEFVMTDRPCVSEFFTDPDAFKYRSGSHLMEMKAITEMAEKDVPIEVRRDDDGNIQTKRNEPTVLGGTMVEAFSQHPDFDREYTRERVDEYLSRGYNPVSCEKIWQQADQFCLKDECGIWQDANVEAHR